MQMHIPKTALPLAAGSSLLIGGRISAPGYPDRLAVPLAVPQAASAPKAQRPLRKAAAAARSAPATPMVPTWPEVETGS